MKTWSRDRDREHLRQNSADWRVEQQHREAEARRQEKRGRPSGGRGQPEGHQIGRRRKPRQDPNIVSRRKVERKGLKERRNCQTGTSGNNGPEGSRGPNTP